MFHGILDVIMVDTGLQVTK